MRLKTIIIIVITILLTVVLMQNTGRDHLDFLWATFSISKLLMLFVVALVAFILGYLVGRPKTVKRLGGEYNGEGDKKDSLGTLSQEDKDFIE
jgi:uncharacterized integral membrane protein